MKKINISTKLLSRVFWSLVFDSGSFRLEQRRGELFGELADLDLLRKGAEYDTGSVSASTSWALYAVAHYFCPAQIVEIGTFIGRSAIALARGVDDAGGIAELHTCDFSNNMTLPGTTRSTLIQYPKSSSTQMLEDMNSSGSQWSVDLVHVDGRLRDGDIPLLGKMCGEDVIVILDDFEGLEKGVINYQAIRAAGWLRHHLLIYPPCEDLLSRQGFSDGSVTALMVPSRLIRFTNQ